jgi:hypothetical protein
MTTSSIDPEAVWAALLEFESRDLLQRHFQKRHGRELSVEQISEMAAAFAQARAYFRAAQGAAMSVKPVLLYYGIQSLSVGLILFLSREPSMARIKPSHGLSSLEWRQSLSGGLNGFGNLTVEVNKGVFTDLLAATENAGYFRANSSVVNWKFGADAPPVGFRMTLGSILTKLPDLRDAFATWQETTIPIGVVQTVQVNAVDKCFVIELRTVPADAMLEELFPSKVFGDAAVTASAGRIAIPLDSAPFFAQMTLGSFGIGDLAVLPPFPTGQYISPIGIYYAAAYCLGMFARYYPAQWVGLERLSKGDSARPLVVRLLDLVERVFPDMVLAFLRGPYAFEAPPKGLLGAV